MICIRCATRGIKPGCLSCAGMVKKPDHQRVRAIARDLINKYRPTDSEVLKFLKAQRRISRNGKGMGQSIPPNHPKGVK